MRELARTLAGAVTANKPDFVALVAAAAKVEGTVREALQFLERGNEPFAFLALRVGEPQLRELIDEYRALLRRAPVG